jgi:predicted nucleotide-binding protein (sugar kinase/HSP70/actin superfamily)
MLKVTFPHMGNSYIPFRTLLGELGLEPVIPPPITQKTISLGLTLAPEFVCFPLKVNLGNYIEAIEAGADLIFMAGGSGPCRFGYYGELQREILHEAGYPIDLLVLESPDAQLKDLWGKLKRFLPRHRVADFIRAAYLAWLKAKALDDFDKLTNRIRPMEKWSGTLNQLQKKYYRALDEADLATDIKKVHRQGLAELRAVAVNPEIRPLRIMLVGEIYMVLEAQINFQIEQVLGEMGVAVTRTIYLTEWVYEHLLLGLIYPHWNQKHYLAAGPYLGNFVGGHGIETVAHTVSAGINNYHGVVQVAPFTCMPEIVAMQIIPVVTKDLDIPVLSLIIDEHAGEAGIHTRLEAFIDLLNYRRKRQSDVDSRKRKVENQ